MAQQWQEGKRGSRRHGEGEGGNTDEASLAHRLSRIHDDIAQGSYAKGSRRPEWICAACGTKNWLDTAWCRWCNDNKLTVGSQVISFWGQITQLVLPQEQLPPAGSSTSSWQPQQVQARASWHQHTFRDTRPLGRRMDSATSRVNRAAKAMERAQTAVVEAQQGLNAANAEYVAGEKELEELQREALTAEGRGDVSSHLAQPVAAEQS